MQENLSVVILGNTVAVNIVTQMYEQGASKAHVVSGRNFDNVYVFGTWGNDKGTAFARARRIKEQEYEIFSSSIIFERLSKEKKRILLGQLVDIVGGATERAYNDGKLFKTKSPEEFYFLPKDDKLIGELDSLLELLGCKIDKLYEIAKQESIGVKK